MFDSGYNMPPGVFESDIPGNRPRDVAADQANEQLTDEWAEHCADHEGDCEHALVHRQEVDDEGEFVICMKLITKYDPESKTIVLWGKGGCDPAECPFFDEHVEERTDSIMNNDDDPRNEPEYWEDR